MDSEWKLNESLSILLQCVKLLQIIGWSTWSITTEQVIISNLHLIRPGYKITVRAA